MDNLNNSTPGELIIFSGIPGSGKTTRAIKLMEELRAAGNNVLRVNRDDLRTMLFGEDYHKGPVISEAEVEVTSFQYKLINTGLQRGWIVISDDTNLRSSGINSLKRLAAKHKAKARVIQVLVELKVALERNQARSDAGGRFVPEDVIESMFERQKNSLRAQGVL